MYIYRDHKKNHMVWTLKILFLMKFQLTLKNDFVSNTVIVCVKEVLKMGSFSDRNVQMLDQYAKSEPF